MSLDGLVIPASDGTAEGLGRESAGEVLDAAPGKGDEHFSGLMVRDACRFCDREGRVKEANHEIGGRNGRGVIKYLRLGFNGDRMNLEGSEKSVEVSYDVRIAFDAPGELGDVSKSAVGIGDRLKGMK